MRMGKLNELVEMHLHTISSREVIKPTYSTPSHLRTYNLSQLDQLVAHRYIPLILFYPNNENCSVTADDKAREIKKSLSHSLIKYHPFAGTLATPTTPFIDCNDEGVVFIEAQHDSQLDKFQHISEQNETMLQLFADDMAWFNSHGNRNHLLGVQLNHFACGGLAVAISMSHCIGDACTLASFVNYWAYVARYGSTDHKEVQPLSPHFVYTSRAYPCPPAESDFIVEEHVNLVTKKFVFSNSKISDLKKKVVALGEVGCTLPTRVEALTALIYKTAVEAATQKSGSFVPSYLSMPVDVRKKCVPKLPQTTVGNILSAMMITTMNTSEKSLSVVASKIRKAKEQVERVQSIKQATENYKSVLSVLERKDVAKRIYCVSSFCGFPFYKADFGWGNPAGATVYLKNAGFPFIVLMDTPAGDGIEALVSLVKEDMEIFEKDKEMLSFCQINQI